MIRVEFQGGQELARRLNELSTRASKAVLRDALLQGAEPMRKRASELAPREPGPPDLADNIVVSVSRATEGAAVAMGPQAKSFFYGWFQEFGTSRHSAQPFMRPSFDLTVQQSVKVIGAALWRALSRSGVGNVSQGSRNL